jgi:hypothetical protein
MSKGKRPDWIAWNVNETGGGQARWRELGAAFAGEKETITILLDAVPLTGKIVLMPPKPKAQEAGAE